MRPFGAPLAVALALSSPAAFAEKAPAAAKPPVFGTEISLVSVPVFVVDRDGRAMRGLAADDFELAEDGKPSPIVSFQYIDTTEADEAEAIQRSPAARRHFLLLFDMSFTDPGGLHRARETAADFVRRRLAPSDLAAVATFDVNRGIRIVANFTEDRPLLLHAVSTLGVAGLARINDPLSLSADIVSTDIQANAAGRFGETSGAVTDQVSAAILRMMRAADQDMYRRQVMMLVGSLEELAKGLRGVEGRKQVLYFSAGFNSETLVGFSPSDARSAAIAITEGRLQDVDHASRYGDATLRGTLNAMVRQLSSADCVVHSIDVTGLGSDMSLTRSGVHEDLARDVTGRESLNFLASETGGRFFKDSNDLGAALGEILDMTSRYYILGYQPGAGKGPGTFHKLKVKVRRKGARLSHRTGYFERLPRPSQAPLQRKFEAAQLVMTGVGTSDLAFSALCLPFPDPGARQTLGVVLQVPRGDVRWQAGQATSLEVYGYAVAADGVVHDHLAQLARFDPGRADPQGQARGVSFYGTFRVLAGKYTVKLMVQDPESGAAGVQFIDVTVPPYEPAAGFLLPPVVMDEASSWLGLEMSAGRPGAGESPFVVAGRPFLPRTSFQVKTGMPEKLVLIAYEPDAPRDPAAGIEIRSSLRNAAGAPVAGGRVRLEKMHREGHGRRTYVLDYTPEGLAPGDYTLRIGIGEAGSHLESYSLLRVRAGS
jgi:VWFA-related protein